MSGDDELRRESERLRAELESGLLALERADDRSAVPELFRAAHTLKGNCGMAGLDGAATLAHAVEDLLSAVRAGEVEPVGAVIDGALDAVDGIGASLSGDEGEIDPERTASALRDRIAERREAPSSPGTDAGSSVDIDVPAPDPDADLSVEEALDRASVFDDLDELVDEVDDDEAFGDLEGGGSFGDLVDDGTHESDSAWESFQEIKADVERDDVDALQRDLEDVEFGEFDDDDVSIQELVDVAGDDAAGADDPEPADDSADDEGTSDPEPATGEPVDDAEVGTEVAVEADDAGVETADAAIEADADAADGTDDDESPFEYGIAASAEDAAADDDDAPADDGAPETDAMDALADVDLSELSGDAADVEFARDERTVEFEERFGELFDAGPAEDEPAGRPGAVGTIEESSLDAGRVRPAMGSVADEGSTLDGRTHSVSVDVETADALLNLVQELSMARLRLESAVGPEPDEAIEDALADLRGIAAEFRRPVMDARLMPLERVVDGLERVVRDVAREGEARVTFEVDGADVHLDRSVVERLREPLVHLVRNAADHGIEPPEERERAGKPAEGRIELRAERVRDGAVIEIEDDGRGIDAASVLEAAREAGVVTPEETAAMDDEDARDLLFRQGLSTAESVTDVSGRGVGMNVVERAIDDLDGSIEVESTPGEGTTVRLWLPVTVAVTELLFVEAGDETYAVPVSAVEHVDDREGVDAIDAGDAVRPPARAWDDEPEEEEAPYPLVRLDEAFDVPERGSADGAVVWIRPETERIAIGCDAVTETREAVVEPYGTPLDGIPGISGATMLGDGSVVNIIDVTSLA